MSFYSDYERVMNLYRTLTFCTDKRNECYNKQDVEHLYYHYGTIIDVICHDFMQSGFSFLNKYTRTKCYLSTGDACMIVSMSYCHDNVDVTILSTGKETKVKYNELRFESCHYKEILRKPNSYGKPTIKYSNSQKKA